MVSHILKTLGSDNQEIRLKAKKLLYSLNIELKSYSNDQGIEIRGSGTVRFGPKKSSCELLSQYIKKDNYFLLKDHKLMVPGFRIEEAYSYEEGALVFRRKNSERQIKPAGPLIDPIALFIWLVGGNRDGGASNTVVGQLLAGGKIKRISIQENKEEVLFLSGEKVFLKTRFIKNQLKVWHPKSKISISVEVTLLKV